MSITPGGPYNLDDTLTAGDSGQILWSEDAAGAVNDIHTRLTVLEGTAYVGPFDAQAAPLFAVSLRRLLVNYKGPLIRVRRSSDNAEMDVYPDATTGDLDVTAMNAWGTTSSLYVVKWYDQSGFGRDVGQTTTGRQPRISNAGTPDTLNSKIGVKFDGTDDYLTRAAIGAYAAGAATMAIVFSGASASNGCVVSEHQTGSNGIYRMLRSGTAAINVQGVNDAGGSMWANSVASDTTFDAAQHQVFYQDTGSAISTWRDNTAKHVALTATRATTTPASFTLGAHAASTPANWMTGFIQECVIWGSDQVAQRATIQTIQKSYWGTP